MDTTLSLTDAFIKKMNASNSVLAKKDVLKQHKDMIPMLEAVYNPFKKYHVKSANVKKNKHLLGSKNYATIYELLTDLNKRLITGHEAIGCINNFVKENSTYEDIIYRIIDKDLKCRVGAKIINEVFPETVPVFNVALAESNYDDVKNKINVTDYYASHKLDGCRCIVEINKEGSVRFFSREGLEFTTLDVLKEDILTLSQKNTVLDGEICIVDEFGVENFKGIMKVIKRKNFTIPNPKFKVFDALSYDDFYNEYSEDIFETRQQNLSLILKDYAGDKIDKVEQIKIKSEEHLNELRQHSINQGWEGLILRKNTVYKGERTRDLLKIKEMYDAEFIVESMQTGPFRIIENGLEKTIDTMTAVTIKYKGNSVSVGSGFSLGERKFYYDNPEKIVGKLITIKYTEETTNEKGDYSLRFPIFKINHGDKRNT